MREAAGGTITCASPADPTVTQEKGLLFRPITGTRVLSYEGLPLDDDGWGVARGQGRPVSGDREGVDATIAPATVVSTSFRDDEMGFFMVNLE